MALSSFYDEDGGGQEDAVDVDGDSLVETVLKLLNCDSLFL